MCNCRARGIGATRDLRCGEQCIKLARNDGAVGIQHNFKCRPVGAVHRLGDTLLLLIHRRQCLGLLVIDILKSMLQIAQKNIGRSQLIDARGFQQSVPANFAEGLARGSQLQTMLAPAANQLVELDDELDLADAAGANLDIVESIALGGLGADLCMQIAHLLDCAEVVIAAVDKRRDQIHQRGLD